MNRPEPEQPLPAFAPSPDAATPDCDAARVRQLLQDELPEPFQAQVTEHIAQCPHCQQTLEMLAGETDWWTEVKTGLREWHAGHAKQASGEVISAESAAELAENFACDFVVDFLEPCAQPETLGSLGEYEILEVIGQGGMGVVLKGFQRELGRYVAVKVMAPHLATSGAARQRFVREARASAAIVHPNVMPIHAVCTTSRLPYLVMPYVACESLQQRLDRQGALELTEILRIGWQVAAGLAAAHAQGLVHRDVKPANILLEKGVDRVMLTDFGLARAADDGSLTRTGVLAGTPHFMSPEQAQGGQLDARSDLFSLGSVLYVMGTCRLPFRAETALGILRRVSDTQPRPMREINAEIPDWLERLVHRLHEKLPEARWSSATEVAGLLEQCLAHVQQPLAVPLPASLKLENQPSRDNHWLIRGGAAIAVILLSVGVAWPFWQTDRSESATAEPANAPAARAHSQPSDPQTTNTAETELDLSQFTDEAVNREVEQFGRQLNDLEQRLGESAD